CCMQIGCAGSMSATRRCYSNVHIKEVTMTRLHVRSFLLTFVAVLALVRVTTASASAPTSASGTFTYTSATFNSSRSAGGNTIIDLSAMVAYTGTFNGTSTLHGILIFHPNGSATFHDVETFTGTVNGVPGSVTFNLNGSSDAAGVVSATDVVVSAS